MRVILIILVALLAGAPDSAIAKDLTLVYSVDIGGDVALVSKISAFARGVREGGRPTLLVDGGNAPFPRGECLCAPSTRQSLCSSDERGRL